LARTKAQLRESIERVGGRAAGFGVERDAHSEEPRLPGVVAEALVHAIERGEQIAIARPGLDRAFVERRRLAVVLAIALGDEREPRIEERHDREVVALAIG